MSYRTNHLTQFEVDVDTHLAVRVTREGDGQLSLWIYDVARATNNIFECKITDAAAYDIRQVLGAALGIPD